MSRRAVVLLTITATILVAIAGMAYWHWTSSVAYSLRQIQDAIRSHDAVKFQKYVNLESLSSRLVDDLASQAMRDQKESSPSATLGTALAAGLMQLMKPRLVELIREQAVRFVEQGRLEPQPRILESTSADKGLSLDRITTQLGAEPSAFGGIQYIRTEGKISLVGLRLRNGRLRADLVLELKMRDAGGYWELVEFSNFTQLLEQIRKLEAERLAEVNGPILQEISNSLKVVSASKTNSSDRWEIERKVHLAIELENTSRHEISGFLAVVQFFDRSGKLVKEAKIRSDRLILPTEHFRGAWVLDINLFDADSKRLYELSNEDVRIVISLTRIEFSRGKVLKVYESLDENEK